MTLVPSPRTPLPEGEEPGSGQSEMALHNALPTVALVGRPNVGKSTLFNALTRTRDALVADLPGLTRDRRYGYLRIRNRDVVAVDTGGLTSEGDALSILVSEQAALAIEASDVVVLVLDARAGLTGADQRIADRLRRSGKPILLAANKIDGLDESVATNEFHALGLGEPIPIAAVHRRGIGRFTTALAAILPPDAGGAAARRTDGIRICIIGRPNTGKSTLVNRLVGDDRVLAHDAPGTTRDSVEVPFERDGRRYTLIDTAGIRRRARVSEPIEKFSIVKSLQAVASSDVAIVVLDASAGMSEQDTSLLGLVLDGGRAPVVAINKWDLPSGEDRAALRSEVRRRLAFAPFCPVCRISALHGTGLGELMRRVDACHRSAFASLAASRLTRELAHAIEHTPPPLVRGRRIKLRYAHQGGANPPVIVVHGNQTELVPASYRRYLAGRFRSAFALVGTPLRIEFRTGENPFQGRRNTLTPRQRRRRERLMRHVARRSR